MIGGAMSELLQDVSKAIAQHLPKQTADVLQERLRDADWLEKENAKLHDQYINAIKERDEWKKKAGDIESRERDVASAKADMESREFDLRSREFEYRMAEERVDAAVGAKRDIMELASIVFRNPRLVTTVTESASRQMPMPSGGYTQTVIDSKTTTTEAEER
jgi:hypothetical protein